MMMEKKVFPPKTDLEKTLDLYFMTCSIDMSAEALAIAGTNLN